MSFDQEAPFGRGNTYAGIGGAAPASTDGQEFEGMEKRFADLNWGNRPLVQRSNRYCECMIVRNAAAFNILPSRLVQLSDAAIRQVTGYTTTGAQKARVSDEWLPTAGVPQYDLFWLLLTGPTIIYTGSNADATNVITADDDLTALTTASSSGGTSAGRIKTADWTGATAVLAKEIAHIIGVAMSAATTANTNTGILVDVNRRSL